MRLIFVVVLALVAEVIGRLSTCLIFSVTNCPDSNSIQPERNEQEDLKEEEKAEKANKGDTKD